MLDSIFNYELNFTFLSGRLLPFGFGFSYSLQPVAFTTIHDDSVDDERSVKQHQKTQNGQYCLLHTHQQSLVIVELPPDELLENATGDEKQELASNLNCPLDLTIEHVSVATDVDYCSHG